MLRIVVTALITAIAAIGWLVLNPADSGRQFLDTLGVLEVLQENYAASPNDGTSPPPAPDSAQSPNSSLPRESDFAIRPGQTSPAPPPSSAPRPQAGLSPPAAAPPARGTDYDQLIANLQEENNQLKTKIDLYEARGGSKSIPSGDRRAIQRQIDANNARIAEFRAWKAKAK